MDKLPPELVAKIERYVVTSKMNDVIQQLEKNIRNSYSYNKDDYYYNWCCGLFRIGVYDKNGNHTVEPLYRVHPWMRRIPKWFNVMCELDDVLNTTTIEKVLTWQQIRHNSQYHEVMTELLEI